MHRPFVSRYGSHLYRDDFAEALHPSKTEDPRLDLSYEAGRGLETLYVGPVGSPGHAGETGENPNRFCCLRTSPKDQRSSRKQAQPA